MNDRILPKRLKELREKSGFLQKFVADKIGVRSNTLSGYENGTRNPDPEIIKDLADLYNVTTDYLLGRSDSPNSTNNENLHKSLDDPTTNLMFDGWAEMTEEERKETLEAIEYIRYKYRNKKK